MEANIVELEKLYNYRTKEDRRAYFANWYREELLTVRRESQEKSTIIRYGKRNTEEE